MSETVLAPVTAEQATKLLRHVEPTEALEAGILTPMAGTRAIRLFSLEEAERFLIIHDGSALAEGGAWATVNYVDPIHLAKWVGEVLGDQQLSAELATLAASREPFGFLVPELKSLIAARIEQCKKVLGIVEVTAN
jgi:hypothetical protein